LFEEVYGLYESEQITNIHREAKADNLYVGNVQFSIDTDKKRSLTVVLVDKVTNTSQG